MQLVPGPSATWSWTWMRLCLGPKRNSILEPKAIWSQTQSNSFPDANAPVLKRNLVPDANAILWPECNLVLNPNQCNLVPDSNAIWTQAQVWFSLWPDSGPECNSVPDRKAIWSQTVGLDQSNLVLDQSNLALDQSNLVWERKQFGLGPKPICSQTQSNSVPDPNAIWSLTLTWIGDRNVIWSKTKIDVFGSVQDRVPFRSKAEELHLVLGPNCIQRRDHIASIWVWDLITLGHRVKLVH